jgi:AcrR family transcriptional regulator
MPRVVDEEERRRTIADIAWRIAANEGLSAVTYRRVAAEMHASTAVVSHAFPNREALLQEVFRIHVSRWMDDLRDVAAIDDPHDRLVAILRGASPLSPAALDDARVWIATMGPPNQRSVWLDITREFGQLFMNEVARALRDMGADESLAYPLSALVWGLNAAAVEDSERWSVERATWSIEVMLEAMGLGARMLPLIPRSRTALLHK